MIENIQENMKSMSSHQGLVNDVCTIIDEGRQKAYASVNSTMIETYWKIGKRIVKEEQCGYERAEYGKRIIEQLSNELTMRYGKGFSKRYLAYFRKFYLTIDDIQILQTVCKILLGRLDSVIEIIKQAIEKQK